MPLSRRAFVAAAAAPLLAQRGAARRPNLLLILADNLAAHALGCYGNQEIRTPNIDLLARGGTRFSLHYSVSPASAAGRASLLTGLTPRQHGIDDGQAPARAAQLPFLHELLAAAGYVCGFAGHWGLPAPGAAPQGFSFWRPVEDGPAAGFVSGRITEHAIEFLEQQKPQQPFFLLASYPEPGNHYRGRPEKYYGLYETAQFTTVNWQPAAANAAEGKEFLNDIVASLRLCAAAITAFDDQVRALVSAVDKMGRRDDTLIVLTSCCGHLMGRHGLWGAGRASNPINMFEESVRTPMIWNWPLHVPVEGARPEIADSCDLLPALCEAAGISVPETPARPGRSYLLSALNKPYPPKNPWRSLTFGHLGDTEMARDLRYKVVIRNQGQGPNELYDLRRDPGETDNEFDSGEYVTVAEALGRQLAEWRKRYS